LASEIPALEGVLDRLGLGWSASDEWRCLRARAVALRAYTDPTFVGSVDPLPLTDGAVAAAVAVLAERCRAQAPELLSALTGRVEMKRRRIVTERSDWEAMLRLWSHLPAWRDEDLAVWWRNRLGERLPAPKRRKRGRTTAAGGTSAPIAVMFAAANGD
jgi:hypothetical protein